MDLEHPQQRRHVQPRGDSIPIYSARQRICIVYRSGQTDRRDHGLSRVARHKDDDLYSGDDIPRRSARRRKSAH